MRTRMRARVRVDCECSNGGGHNETKEGKIKSEKKKMFSFVHQWFMVCENDVFEKRAFFYLFGLLSLSVIHTLENLCLHPQGHPYA